MREEARERVVVARVRVEVVVADARQSDELATTCRLRRDRLLDADRTVRFAVEQEDRRAHRRDARQRVDQRTLGLGQIVRVDPAPPARTRRRR